MLQEIVDALVAKFNIEPKRAWYLVLMHREVSSRTRQIAKLAGNEAKAYAALEKGIKLSLAS